MSKVFIVQETDRNVQSAREYGELRVLLSYKDSKQELVKMYNTLYARLTNIEYGDYILCIGDPIAIGLSVHIALNLIGDKELNFLKWDKVQMKYAVLKL